MKTEFILYDPEEFNKVQIKPDTTREELEALREENARLREILKECVDDLEDAVNAQYGEMARKVMPDRYERDMQSVMKARAAIREAGEDE